MCGQVPLSPLLKTFCTPHSAVSVRPLQEDSDDNSRTFRPEGVDATPRVVRPRHSFLAATLRISAFCGRSRLGSSVSCRSRAIPLVRKAACNLDQCRDPRKRACWQYCSPSGISSYSTSSSSLERSLSKGLRLLHASCRIDGSAAWACLAGDRDAKSWVVLEMLRDQPGQLNRLLSIFAKCAIQLQSSALSSSQSEQRSLRCTFFGTIAGIGLT